MIWRGDGQNRVAACLLVLFDQINPHYPGRATGNDGTLGDASHQAHKSDHNPDDQGIVRALDITHDPAHGFNSYDFADYLRSNWDDRVQYIISNRRIANIDVGGKAWRPYNGENPHDHHIHISARGDSRADDPRPWDLAPFFDGSATTDPHPRIQLGAQGAPVLELQRLLGLPGTGIFDAAMDLAVRSYQGAHALEVDGIVGTLTWGILLGVMTSKGSWYSQFDGKFHWHDGGDTPNSAALGVPDDAQGIARPEMFGTLGHWFMVKAPNGKVSIEQQTDHGPAKKTGRTIDISAAAAERLGYSPQNFPTDSIFTFWPVSVPREVAGLSKPNQAIKYRDIRKGLPLDGEVLPPKVDNNIVLILILVLAEGKSMDKNLIAAMLAELAKPNPDMRALLQQALLSLGGTALPPPLPPAPAFDFTAYMPLLQSPIVQQLLSGKPITLADLMPLIPAILAISQGQAVPALPAPPKPPTPPPPVIPAVPPFGNNANNWSAGMAAALAALGLSAAGVTGSPIPGDPNFSMTGLLTFLAPLVSAGIAPWIGPFISGVFSKLTAKTP